MACKDKKTQVRIDPRINHLLAIAARIEHKPGYQLLEEIVKDWVMNNQPKIFEEFKKDINLNS